MIPEDADWFDNSGNEPITHDWTNSLQRSVSYEKADESGGTFPSPTGTTLPWGGGKILIYKCLAGVQRGGHGITLDDSIDFRNRLLIVLEAGEYDAANDLPGEVGWVGQGSMLYDTAYLTGSVYTGTGGIDADPPAMRFDLIIGDVYLFADSANGGRLRLWNAAAGPDMTYPFLVVLISDQFPTR